MEILPLSSGNYPRPTAIALGFFDGCHLGHRALLRKTVELARKNGLVPGVFTFQDSAVKPGVELLSTEEERYRQFAELGIETVFVSPFARLKDTLPEDFVTDVLLQICHGEIAVSGDDFHFGANRKGDAQGLVRLMEKYGKSAFTVSPRLYRGEPISSSRIREAVKNGHLPTADRMLGRPFSCKGKVKNGQHLGRTLGIPTANLPIRKGLIVPKDGVYETVTKIGNRDFLSVTNVGMRPTVNRDFPPNIESHLLDFTGDLYGEEVEICFIRRLRGEMKFASVEDLQHQMEEDIRKVRKNHGE